MRDRNVSVATREFRGPFGSSAWQAKGSPDWHAFLLGDGQYPTLGEVNAYADYMLQTLMRYDLMLAYLEHTVSITGVFCFTG